MVIKCEIIWIIDFMCGVIGFSYFGGIDILMWKKFEFRIYIKLKKGREIFGFDLVLLSIKIWESEMLW